MVVALGQPIEVTAGKLVVLLQLIQWAAAKAALVL
jgi:hypothetical protein